VDVFVSVGRIATPKQEDFLRRLEKKLTTKGCTPRIVNRTTYLSGPPLPFITKQMRMCRGVVIVAFERITATGQELFEMPAPPARFENRRYTTPWNHIELAMANLLGLPALVIVEQGIHEEGLVAKGFDWFLHATTLDVADLDTDAFNGRLDEWKERIGERKKPKINVDDMTVGELITGMKPAQLWSALAVAAILISGAFGLGKSFTVQQAVSSASIGSISAKATATREVDQAVVLLSTAAPSSPIDVTVELRCGERGIGWGRITAGEWQGSAVRRVKLQLNTSAIPIDGCSVDIQGIGDIGKSWNFEAQFEMNGQTVVPLGKANVDAGGHVALPLKL